MSANRIDDCRTLFFFGMGKTLLRQSPFFPALKNFKNQKLFPQICPWYVFAERNSPFPQENTSFHILQKPET